MTAEDALFNQFRGKRVLIDANLLLLFLIGTFQRTRIETFKRTNMFSAADFDALVAILGQFKVIVTTPHVLTEVSNLANSLPEYLKHSWSEHFASQTAIFLEVFDPATNVMQQSSFNLYGLTDAAIHCASIDMLVLTADFRLSGFLNSHGVKTIDFRNLMNTLGL